MRKQITQKMGTPWWLTLALLVILVGLYFYEGASDYLYAMIVVFVVSLIRLKVIFAPDSISYRIYPFFKRKVYYSEVKSIKVAPLNALSDFWGWGVRYSMRLGWGYIFFTKKAIYLETEKGKRVISVKDKEEIIAFFDENKYLEKKAKGVYVKRNKGG